MAVNIDTVYQRVLAIANKEQRGYITPQEFNLFANQAQMDIFEQYFYDLNQARRLPGNDTQYSDLVSIIEEKIQVFEHVDGPGVISNNSIYVGGGGGGVNKNLPNYIYRVNRIELNNVNCEIMNTKQYNEVRFTPMTKPTKSRPIANIRKGLMRVNDGNQVTPTGIFYIKKPDKVSWGYIVVNEKALYDATRSVDFELHPSEETELVFKVLALAGISMGGELYQVGTQEDLKNIQQEKA